MPSGKGEQYEDKQKKEKGRFTMFKKRERSRSAAGGSKPQQIARTEGLGKSVARSPKYRVKGGACNLDLLDLTPIPKDNKGSVQASSLNTDGYFDSVMQRKQKRTVEVKKELSEEDLYSVGSAIRFQTFRPAFSRRGSSVDLSAKRFDKELDQVEQFIEILPPILSEGKEMFPSVEQQMDLYIGSILQTDKNITRLLDNLLETDEDQETIKNLIEMSARMKGLLDKYKNLREQYHMDSDDEVRSARQLASRLSKTELFDLLEQNGQVDKKTEKEQTMAALQDLVVKRGILQSVDESGSDNSLEDADELFIQEEECIICLQDYPIKNFRSLPCGHKYCKFCFQGFIESKINDGAVIDLTCPHPDCKEPFTAKDIAELVSAAKANQYDQLKILAELNRNPNCRWCPRPGCNTAMIADPSEKIVICSRCEQEICFKCRQMSHKGKSCKEYEEWRKLNDENEENWSQWAKTNDAKQCPNCGVWIIRPTGCNQVICKSCQYSFCWLCMQECIVPDHYKYGECAGKWFEETNLSTGQRIVAGIILGGVIVLVSPLIALAGTIALGKKLKRRVRRPKNVNATLMDLESSSEELQDTLVFEDSVDESDDEA